jgi:hypothetical protein
MHLFVVFAFVEHVQTASSERACGPTFFYVFLHFSVFSCACRVLTVRCSQSSDPVLQAPAARVLSPAELSDYISFGRQRYTPELTDAAADKLVQGACTSHRYC